MLFQSTAKYKISVQGGFIVHPFNHNEFLWQVAVWLLPLLNNTWPNWFQLTYYLQLNKACKSTPWWFKTQLGMCKTSIIILAEHKERHSINTFQDWFITMLIEGTDGTFITRCTALEQLLTLSMGRANRGSAADRSSLTESNVLRHLRWRLFPLMSMFTFNIFFAGELQGIIKAILRLQRANYINYLG